MIRATRYRKQKNESYTILNPSLHPNGATINPKQRFQDCNMQDTPTPKRSRQDDSFVGCCTCNQKSKCSTSLCVCKKVGIVCTMYRSHWCGNKPTASFIITNQATSTSDRRDYAWEVKRAPYIETGVNENDSSRNQRNINNNNVVLNKCTSIAIKGN